MVKKIDTKRRKEYEGFEDLMDEVVAEREREEFLKRRKDLERYNDTFELYNFLEQETSRLKKVNSFLSEKLPNLKNSPHSNIILTQQKEKTKKTKRILIDELMSPKSTFSKNIKQLWKSSFRLDSK